MSDKCLSVDFTTELFFILMILLSGMLNQV